MFQVMHAYISTVTIVVWEGLKNSTNQRIIGTIQPKECVFVANIVKTPNKTDKDTIWECLVLFSGGAGYLRFNPHRSIKPTDKCFIDVETWKT